MHFSEVTAIFFFSFCVTNWLSCNVRIGYFHKVFSHAYTCIWTCFAVSLTHDNGSRTMWKFGTVKILLIGNNSLNFTRHFLTVWKWVRLISFYWFKSLTWGPKAIKLFYFRLSMNFVLLINNKLPTIFIFFLLNGTEHKIYPANKY